MKRSTERTLAVALIASLLILPPGLSAKGKRGATLVITRTDSTLVTGELIAAKPDSLLLLNTAGQDENVGLGAPEISETPAPAGATTGVPSRSPRRPRFKLSLAATTTFGRPDRGMVRTFEAPWRFPESVPPGESGVYAAPFFQTSFAEASAWILPGPISLAYELTEKWLPEIEVFFTPGEGHGIWGDLSFVSTTDGRTYEGRVGTNLSANFSSVLVGLNYRPIAPSSLERTSLEIGISAGPARVKIGPWYAQPTLVPADRKTVLSARVHVAYDFYFVPAFSLGAFVDYRYLEARFAAMTGTTEAIFYGSGVEPITRQVELSLPARTISRSGMSAGIRIGFRF